MDAGGWPDVRWMRAVECTGDRNVREGGGDGREEEEKEKKEEEKRRGRKEGVRVRVRLGVGGAIRNYCGTIDKRRLRGCTTKDSLRPSDFFSFHSLLFPASSLFSLLPLDFRFSRHAVSSVPVPLLTKPSRLVNM